MQKLLSPKKKFRQINYLVLTYLAIYFYKKIGFTKFLQRESKRKFHCAKISFTKRKIREINYLAIYSIKTLLSRNFCQERVRVDFRNFHTMLLTQLWKNQKFFRQINLEYSSAKNRCSKMLKFPNCAAVRTVVWSCNFFFFFSFFAHDFFREITNLLIAISNFQESSRLREKWKIQSSQERSKFSARSTQKVSSRETKIDEVRHWNPVRGDFKMQILKMRHYIYIQTIDFWMNTVKICLL